jgi:hypothetical protein
MNKEKIKEYGLEEWGIITLMILIVVAYLFIVVIGGS